MIGPLKMLKGELELFFFKGTRETVAMSFKLDISCTNNMVKYESYLIGRAIAHEMGIKHL